MNKNSGVPCTLSHFCAYLTPPCLRLPQAPLVLPRSGSVRFFDYFGRTGNLTDGSVQANLVNPEPDLRFGSEGGPVPVQQWPNSEPNHIYSKKIEFIVNL